MAVRPLADSGIDPEGVRGAGGSGDAFSAQFHSIQGGEMKPLTQTDEKQEQLHSRQSFPQTRTLPCKHTHTHDVASPSSSVHNFQVASSFFFFFPQVPAEKGKNASFLTNFPSASRKCSGLKVSGVSHSFLSNSTEVRLGITDVP